VQHQNLVQGPRQIGSAALGQGVPVLRVRLEELLLLYEALSDGEVFVDVLLRSVHHSDVASVRCVDGRGRKTHRERARLERFTQREIERKEGEREIEN
jgi:hypothetical protein